MDIENIFPPTSLFTWVDIDHHLARLAAGRQWPEWLVSADSWWDALELGVQPGTTQEQIKDWLNTVFGAGSTAEEGGQLQLKLDDPRTKEFTGLPVVTVDESADDPTPPRNPLLREKHINHRLATPLPRPESDSFREDIQLIALHSFKGGVGRTVHAIAVADVLAKRGRNVLLVDADLEAPGITWMHREDGSPVDFSYADLIALLQGSKDGDWSAAVDIAAAYLPNQQVGHHPGRLTILPASRECELAPPRIEPADLLTPDRSPYFLTEALAVLAARIGADTVVVDLRAGATELSAPVLLDPRVQRIFVTTLSHQSETGTRHLIDQLGAKAPAQEGRDPGNAVIITQYRTDVHSAQLEDARERLSTTLDRALEPPDGDNTGSVLAQPALSPFREELLALPSSWGEVLQLLERCHVSDAVEGITPIPTPAPSATAEPGNPEITVKDLRERLKHTAADLIFAEQGAASSSNDFLVTDQLRRLLGDHRTEPPISLVVGAKGAGKTFLHAKACGARTWSEFAERSGIDGVRLDAPIVPVLESGNVQETEFKAQDLRDGFAESHGATRADTYVEICDRIREGLESLGPEDPRGWRHLWLQCLAGAAGADVENAEDSLIALGQQHRAVFVLDGLEDQLHGLETDTKKTALHVLVMDVLTWLRGLRGRPFGLVVFTRRDLVKAAVPQNSEQLLNRYRAYALTWNQEEALRLALWVTTYARAHPNPKLLLSEIAEMRLEQLVEELIPVWGWKLGSERSKEARSHLWVTAALADFNDEVQARDIVEFLKESAALSLPSTDWDSRVLAPKAMRNALQPCSERKITAIDHENPDVGRLLNRLRQQGPVTSPFLLEEVDLTQEQADFLVHSGVLKQTKEGRYRIAEIYRHGVGFGSSRRPTVLNHDAGSTRANG